MKQLSWPPIRHQPWLTFLLWSISLKSSKWFPSDFKYLFTVQNQNPFQKGQVTQKIHFDILMLLRQLRISSHQQSGGKVEHGQISCQYFGLNMLLLLLWAMAIKKVKKNENRTTKKGSYPRMVTLSDWLLLETLPKKPNLKKAHWDLLKME